MKNLKSHLVFNRSQRNGIFLLVIIIILLQGFYFFQNSFFESKADEAEDPQLVLFQQKIDSLRLVGSQKDTPKIYPFNPNFLTDYRGYVLGMSISEIDKLHSYRAGDKWVNSAEDFQRVTGVQDTLLNKISPYFRFPDWVKNNKPVVSKISHKAQKGLAFEEKQDLNSASVSDLSDVKGIGETLAGRIVNYRNKIGGFVNDIQLKDIYGLSFEVREEVLMRFTVKNVPFFEKLDINSASVLQLSEIPYIGYELAREIVNYRLLREKIVSFEELANIKAFPSEKIDRIALYLALK